MSPAFSGAMPMPARDQPRRGAECQEPQKWQAALATRATVFSKPEREAITLSGRTNAGRARITEVADGKRMPVSITRKRTRRDEVESATPRPP